jgi:hypothetical protein
LSSVKSEGILRLTEELWKKLIVETEPSAVRRSHSRFTPFDVFPCRSSKHAHRTFPSSVRQSLGGHANPVPYVVSFALVVSHLPFLGGIRGSTNRHYPGCDRRSIASPKTIFSSWSRCPCQISELGLRNRSPAIVFLWRRSASKSTLPYPHR